MCGIVAYIGQKEDVPKILLEGLKRLEYRGYDSAGLALVDGDKTYVAKVKREGKNSVIGDLAQKVSCSCGHGTVGIAHTRWATHGVPNEINAHPHTDCAGEIFVVHNGIVENYLSLKKNLEKQGHVFRSETDTEILAHLIEEYFEDDLEKAVRSALREVEGTYGLAVISKKDPAKIVVARKGSPLGIGMGENEFIIASDAAPIISHTKQVIYLDDGEMAVLDQKSYQISSIQTNGRIRKEATEIEWDLKEAEKGGYPHFMLKEVFEQPNSIRDSMRGRLISEEGLAMLGGIRDYEDILRKKKNIKIVACGTALYSGMVGEYMLEEQGGIETETEYASEFRYRSPVLDPKHSLVLCISQSGETADTLAAVREAKRKGVLALGIVNTVGSTIARETDAGIYNHAGPEIGVASTKAFTSQLTVLALLSLFLGRQRQLTESRGRQIAEALQKIPRQVKETLRQNDHIKKVARKYASAKNFLFLGRKYNFPIALEGALKLKEISYIHAEGYGAGEMKHGPLALIDENFPTLAIVPNDSVRDKMLSNIKEIQARRGKVIVIATSGDQEIAGLVDDVIYIPETIEMLSPILTVIPLQLFAYHVAVALGRDVDKPRNLAKSVTVE